MSTIFDLLVAFEIHSVERIRSILDAGFDVRTPVKGKAPIAHLIEMYYRSDAFPDCVRLLLDRGAVLEDPVLRPVFLNDVDELEAAIRANPALLQHRTSLACAFTPLLGVTLLHVAAEYGHLEVARKLIELGAEVDARAATDEFGFNGHTPLFHTVNSNENRSAPVMNLLLDAGARPDILLPGITWGQGFEWETLCFDVTPISYAQLGLLRQMQRTEADTYANVATLLRAAKRSVPSFTNVPNRYLASP
ncbi:MAG TPA: ankyrin repeat domain-containing protein [Thermoanaerobaculia bacterium]|nr:ankyrin repeat domain-containing protein [Thermoanaerobaculia bacterium]